LGDNDCHEKEPPYYKTSKEELLISYNVPDHYKDSTSKEEEVS